MDSRSRKKQGEVHFEPGEILFTEKSPGNFFYLVQGGSVEIYITRQYEEIPLAVIGAGQCVGEFAVLDGEPRSASARALTTVTAIKIGEDTLKAELAKMPNWLSGIIRGLVGRIRKTDDILRRNKVVDEGLMDQIHAVEYKKPKDDAEGTVSSNAKNPMGASEEEPS